MKLARLSISSPWLYLGYTLEKNKQMVEQNKDRIQKLLQAPFKPKEDSQYSKQTESGFITVNYRDIVEIVLKQQMSWSTQWQSSIQGLRNILNNYMYTLVNKQNQSQKEQFNRQTLIHATSILEILENSYLKTLTIRFFPKLYQLIPRSQDGVISSITQLMQYVNSDFSSIVFKIHYDIPYLLHFVPRQPQIIGFSDFKDTCIDGRTQTKYASLFSYKQLNWALHTVNKQVTDSIPLEQIKVVEDYIQLRQVDLGIVVQIAYFQGECIIYVPAQNTFESVCFTPEIALKNQQSIIFTIYKELSNQLAIKGYLLHTNQSSLLFNNNSQNPNDSTCNSQEVQNDIQNDYLDQQSVYCLYLSSQKLFNFPATDNVYLIAKYNKQQEVLYNHYLPEEQHLTEKTLCYRDSYILNTNKLNIDQITSFMREYKPQTSNMEYAELGDINTLNNQKKTFPYQFVLSVRNNDSFKRQKNTQKNDSNIYQNTIDQYVITTQFMLFVYMYADHLKQLKKLDTIQSLKDIITLYTQQSNEFQRYQKLKYPVSNLFIQQLSSILSLQQSIFEQSRDLILKALQAHNKQKIIVILEFIQLHLQNKQINTYSVIHQLLNLYSCKKTQLLIFADQLISRANLTFDFDILNNIIYKLKDNTKDTSSFKQDTSIQHNDQQ